MSEGADDLPDCAPVPKSALGPALNEEGCYVGRVEGNLYWITDGTYQSAFLTASDGVVLFDAPPTIGHNIQRAVDEVAGANGVSNKVTHLIYSHHHADHTGASFLFDRTVTRIGHEETRRLLLRDDGPARPPNEETFQDHRTLEIGGERLYLAWHGSGLELCEVREEGQREVDADVGHLQLAGDQAQVLCGPGAGGDAVGHDFHRLVVPFGVEEVDRVLERVA